MAQGYWLLKSEPDVYGIEHLAAEPGQTARWDGIRNYQARNFLRDRVKVGDKAFIYHSQCKTVGIAGTARVVKAAYPDPAQFNPDSPYYDPKATEDKPRWFAIDIALDEVFDGVIPLKRIKQQAELEEMVLLKQGRLSVQPVTPEEWQAIHRLR